MKALVWAAILNGVIAVPIHDDHDAARGVSRK